MKPNFTVFEVGPRDGLQNEPKLVPLKTKAAFVRDLVGAGLRNIEMGAFVRADRVPQMADTEALYRETGAGLPIGAENVEDPARYWSLVPNRRGMVRALKCGASNVAVFTAATESFARRNIGMSVKDSVAEFRKVVELARAWGGGAGTEIRVRGYISTAFWCPFEGRTKPAQTLRVIEKLVKTGMWQVSVGDTIGAATPADIEAVMKPAIRHFGAEKIAGHFHDTRGTALANALRAVQLGVRTLDSSAGGLGGCPFAPGASGNLATEDLVYLLQGLGFHTGIDLDKLCQASAKLARSIRRPLTSRYLQAWASSQNRR